MNKQKQKSKTKNEKHQPVLLEQVLSLMEPKKGESYLDLTVGYGGHARAISERVGTKGEYVLVDQDLEAVEYLRQEFDNTHVIHSDYESQVKEFAENRRQFDMILLDLGVSSPQLDNQERGFSFQKEGPLDMRMDRTRDLKASSIVNKWPENKLADLIYEYGEERQSRPIARTIVSERPIETTTELADVIKNASRSRGRIHPATRTFQALRIAVNDELGQLERTLPFLPEIMKVDGRLAIISFHSLEDRKVKRFFKNHAVFKRPDRHTEEERRNRFFQILTKKPIGGTEKDNNPRARSAKLRAVSKIKTKDQKEVRPGH